MKISKNKTRFLIKNSEKFGWEGVDGWSATIPKKASLSYIEVNVDIPSRKNSVNDRLYLIVEGSAKFKMANKSYLVKEKEAVFIPKNTEYSYSPAGKIKLVEMNVPPFSLNSEKIYNK